MIKFRTVVSKGNFPFRIHHQSKILCIGSCFAEHIGNKLDHYKFPIELNPFGILYNPLSIAQSLDFLLKNRKFQETDLVQHDGIWHSFYHHSRFSNINPKKALSQINEALGKGAVQLRQADILTITFGSSYIFKYKESGKTVANCHKIPARSFQRERLSLESIIEHLIPLLQNLKSENPNLNIILTVSPVRHIKDGLIENQRSKAILLLASEQLAEQLDFVHYFPAYEIMMDDLRDYRFYKNDMLHPNSLAIDYIWQFFADTFFEQETMQLNADIEKIKQAVNHKAFQPASEKHQQFLKNQLKRIEQLQQRVTSLNFNSEIQHLQSQLLYE